VVQRSDGRSVRTARGGPADHSCRRRTGAAPFLSLLESWFENGTGRDAPISFFFGVGKRRDLFLDEQFPRWAATRKDFTYIPALVRLEEGEGWSGETGYISNALDRHLTAPSAAEAYVADRPRWCGRSRKCSSEKAKERIHYDPITVQ
jgi:NAD(P)H-flavin reductase